MRRLFSYIFTIISSAILLFSCTDDTFNEGGTLADGQVGLKLALNLPGGGSASTRAGGTDAETGTENGLEYENWLHSDDVRLLLFSNNRFAEEVTKLQITGTQGSKIRYLVGTANKSYEENTEIVVLANLKSRNVTPSTAAFEGKTVEEVYKLLEYTYGKNPWKLNQDERVPMWGSLNMYLKKGKVNSGNINLYRAISKINLLVNEGEGLGNFELRSIYVYYANQKGYCAPLPSDAVAESPEVQFTRTSIPVSTIQNGTDSPLSYIIEKGASAFENQIYIPESNNKEPGSGKKPLCLVVGGIYAGDGLVEPGEESYYRIDFKDDLESQDKDDLRTYDVIRNHAYVFNIRSVSRPGTTTPEEALDNVVVGMDVSIEEWVNEFMRGIPDQYTLTTNKSVVTFDKSGKDIETSQNQAIIDVWTDYELNTAINNGTWEIEDGNAAEKGFTVTKSSNNQVIITAAENNAVSKTAYFYVTAGNIKKQIIVKQKQPITSNCYIVADGEHTLIVNIKGNGNDGIYAVSDKPGVGNVKLVEENQTDASISPDKIGIIWETKAGLVTLIEPNGRRVSGAKGAFAQFDKTKGTIQYQVNTSGTLIGGVQGGNALIGAFKSDGTLLWSWHIWACPNMVNTSGIIKEECIQNWTLNGYKVMDRNLGALSNQPGVASLGLLYQWGRKDPFIGANYTNDNYTGTGVMNTEWYYEEWGVEGRDANDNKYSEAIPYTIKHPTKLIQAGLSKSRENRSALLWGTDGGLNKDGVKDLGSKTIYDPCPEGYRVPPVDAFVFKTNKIVSQYTTKEITVSNNITYFSYTPTTWKAGSKSSETVNWNDNVIYIPHRVVGRRSDYYSSDTYYSGPYIIEAEYYGFYLNYDKIIEPVLTHDYKKAKQGTGQYYFYKPTSSETTLTWLPLSGAYDPTKFKSEGNKQLLTFKGVTIEKGSSITVNSFLWTNSSVKSGTGSNAEVIPAAMFLHGTEVDNDVNGRHIHGLTKSDINAEPHYAGAVRCVRDIQKDFTESNSIPESISLGKIQGSTTSGKVVSINDTWKVIDPGASWVKITPDSGVADKGRGTIITFTATKANDTGKARTTTVLFKFANENAVRELVITQQSR